MRQSPRSPRTVLIITYAFPPAAYVGVYRTLKYCKYLGEYGWRSIVLTIRTEGVASLDESLCREVPESVDVIRTRDLDPAKWLDRFSAWRHRHHRPRVAASGQGQDSAKAAPVRRGWLATAKRFLVRLLTESPDSHVFWIPFAILRGARILLTRDVDVLYSTSPPHSSHLIAYVLGRCFRKPFVLDFRDPWIVDGSAAPGTTGGIFVEAQARVKRTLVAHAAAVIAVSEGDRRDLIGAYPDLDTDRCVFITNGYDPDDFRDLGARVADPSKLVLTHAGTIYSGAADEFFQALELVVRDHAELRDSLRIDLLGFVHPEYAPAVGRLERLGVLRTRGLLPHKAALEHARDSDVLVILRGGSRLASELPAKVFEYLHLARPILAVSREGDLSRLLTTSRTGIVVPPGDPARLAATLWDLHVRFRAGRLRVDPDMEYIRTFERRPLTGTLASVLDRVVA